MSAVSIPHKLTILAVKFYSEQFTELKVEVCLFILDVLEYLLTHNFFMFNGEYYLQRCGAAKGAKFCPPSPICTWRGGNGAVSLEVTIHLGNTSKLSIDN